MRLDPAPGTATIDDLVSANSNGVHRCELIDHTLMEKVTGYEASVVAATILEFLRRHVASRKLGLVSGTDGFFQLLTSSVRGPDVALVLRDRLRNARGRRIAIDIKQRFGVEPRVPKFLVCSMERTYALDCAANWITLRHRLRFQIP